MPYGQSRAKMDLHLWVQSSCWRKQQQHHKRQQKSLYRVEMSRLRIRMQNLLHWPVWWNEMPDDDQNKDVEEWNAEPQNFWIRHETCEWRLSFYRVSGQKVMLFARTPLLRVGRLLSFSSCCTRPSLSFAAWAPVGTALSSDTVCIFLHQHNI